MAALKHTDSPAVYINIYLPTFSESNTGDFLSCHDRDSSENVTVNINENV